MRIQFDKLSNDQLSRMSEASKDKDIDIGLDELRWGDRIELLNNYKDVVRDVIPAASAMLAALELVKADPAANMLSSATWNDIKQAIAAAKAAGIKSES